MSHSIDLVNVLVLGLVDELGWGVGLLCVQLLQLKVRFVQLAAEDGELRLEG
jgi:hypothetical protein